MDLKMKYYLIALLLLAGCRLIPISDKFNEIRNSYLAAIAATP